MTKKQRYIVILMSILLLLLVVILYVLNSRNIFTNSNNDSVLDEKISNTGETTKDNIVSIPNIEIICPDELQITIIDADPKYLDRENQEQTLLSFTYEVKNNSSETIKGSSYDISIRCYDSGGYKIFEKVEFLLFYGKLDSKTSCEATFHSGFINGIDIIDRLVIEID